MIAVFNPSRNDFICKYDNKLVPAAKSNQITRYEEDHIGLHVKKHLIDFIMNEREINSLDQVRRDKITQEVSYV